MGIRNHAIRGFSGIDVTFIFAIVLLLVALFVFQIDTMNKKVRDSRRVADLQQIHKALTEYALDNKYLPASKSLLFLSDSETKYLETVPDDPLGGPYRYDCTANLYSLSAHLENPDSLRNSPHFVGPDMYYEVRDMSVAECR
jgi:type II secretory pathway pseudopilin PulG